MCLKCARYELVDVLAIARNAENFSTKIYNTYSGMAHTRVHNIFKGWTGI